MHKAIKWIGIALGAAVVIFGLVVAYIVATFNPNDYKANIIQAVQEKTGRTLQLKGDLILSIFPTLGAKVRDVSLSEVKSEREFASVTEAIVAVKLMPLLSRDVIVDAIEVKGLRAIIVREKSGRLNVDDITGAKDEEKKKEEASRAVQVDIDHIRISDGDVTFIDQAAGTQYRLAKLDVKTGRVAEGVTTPLEFSASITSSKDKAQLATSLKGKLTFDTARQIYRLENLDFSAKGVYGELTGLNATMKGSVEARLATGEYVANALTVAFTGKQAGADLNVKLDAPKLTLTKDKVEGGKIVLEAQRSEPKGKLTAKIALGGVQGAFKAMTAGPLDTDVEMSGDGRTVKAKLRATLTGNLEARRFELPKLTINATVNDPKLPTGAFAAAIAGSARADLAKESAGLDFSGKLDESNVSGRAGVTAFSPLAVTFNLTADQLDVDRLLGRKPGEKSAGAKPAGDKGSPPGGKDDKIDLSALKGLNAAGAVQIGKLTAFNVKTSQVRADLKVADGRLNVSPISAQLYQGTLNGSLSAQAADNAVFAIKQNLSGVSVGPLLRDAADIDTLDGKGSLNIDLTTRGASVTALKKALHGTAALNLADGSLKGIDIAGTIRNARTKLQELRGQQVQKSDKTQKTDFTDLKATFNIKNGVAHNNDLDMRSPLLRIAGAGDIDIGNDRLDYLLKTTLVATSKGQGGRDLTDLSGVTIPVKLTGALDAPQWSIDYSGMIAGVATQKLQEEILKRIPGQAPPQKAGEAARGGRVEDVIKDRLKGIFGR